MLRSVGNSPLRGGTKLGGVDGNSEFLFWEGLGLKLVPLDGCDPFVPIEGISSREGLVMINTSGR